MKTSRAFLKDSAILDDYMPSGRFQFPKCGTRSVLHA